MSSGIVRPSMEVLPGALENDGRTKRLSSPFALGMEGDNRKPDSRSFNQNWMGMGRIRSDMPVQLCCIKQLPNFGWLR